MKARYAATSLLLSSLIALASANAMASDDVAGMLLGAGTGAIIGNAVNGSDGAVVGGFLGALIGVAAADGNAHRAVIVRPRPQPVYGPPGVRYYVPPRPGMGPHPVYTDWRRGRHMDFDAPRHDDWRGHDRNGWQEGRGPRDDHPGNRRNW
jgi:hypothetical protein